MSDKNDTEKRGKLWLWLMSLKSCIYNQIYNKSQLSKQLPVAVLIKFFECHTWGMSERTPFAPFWLLSPVRVGTWQKY